MGADTEKRSSFILPFFQAGSRESGPMGSH